MHTNISTGKYDNAKISNSRILLKGQVERLVMQDDNKKINKLIEEFSINPFIMDCSCGLIECNLINPSDYLKKKIADKIDFLIQQEKLIK